MKTLLALSLTAFAAATTLAQTPAAPSATRAAADAKLAELAKKAAAIPMVKHTRAEMESRPAVLKKTGGFVDVAPRGTSVLVVDARAKSGGAPAQFGEIFANLSKTFVAVKKEPLAKDACPIKMITDRRDEIRAVYAIAVVDDAKLPGVSVFPEERIAVVNAAKYQSGPDPVRREERIHKELWRSLGFVAGVGYAAYQNDVLQPIASVPELDALEYQVMQPMNFQKIYTVMGKRGVTRARHIPYRLACREGWAAAPTNEYQKAVWEQVKAEKNQKPTNPMKITKPAAKK